jgi:hypothetical protein
MVPGTFTDAMFLDVFVQQGRVPCVMQVTLSKTGGPQASPSSEHGPTVASRACARPTFPRVDVCPCFEPIEMLLRRQGELRRGSTKTIQAIVRLIC